MSENGDSLSRKIAWHLLKIPIVSLVLLVLVASVPQPGFSDMYGSCPCDSCELARMLNSLDGIERWWLNFRVNISTITQSLF